MRAVATASGAVINRYSGALRGVADEADQVPRLQEFRIRHPDVVLGPDEFRNWQARIPEPNGETVITRYRLRELLDKLDERYGLPQRPV